MTRLPPVVRISAAALIAAGAMAGAVVGGGPAAATPVQAGAPAPGSVAAQDAAALLASFAPPPDSVRLSGEPGNAPAAADRPMALPADPDQVVRTAWWSAVMSPSSVLAWVRGHPPVGAVQNESVSRVSGAGVSAARRELSLVGFGAAPVPGIINARELEVAVYARLGGGSVMRVDAIVDFLPVRPATEVIPRADSLTATVIYPMPVVGARRSDSSVTTTDPAVIARITDIINRLPLQSPGTFSCPSVTGAGIALTFRAGNGSTLAAAFIATSGCGGVSVVIGGMPQPDLAGTSTLIGQIDATLGTRWDPSRPGPSTNAS